MPHSGRPFVPLMLQSERTHSMTDEELRNVVTQAFHRIAPEADLQKLPGDADLHEEIDLHSMAFSASSSRCTTS